jgi:hypothetical protein
MSIESKIPQEQEINIQELAFTPAVGPVFDIEKEVSSNEWEHMRESIRKERDEESFFFGSTNVALYFHGAAALAVMFPERRDQLYMNEASWRNMKREVAGIIAGLADEQNILKKGSYASVIRYANEFKQVVPEHFHELGITDAMWKNLVDFFLEFKQGVLSKNIGGPSLIHITNIAAGLKRLRPEATGDLKLSDQDFEWMKAEVPKIYNTNSDPFTKYRELARQIGNIRILFPNKQPAEYFSSDDIKFIRKELEDLKSENKWLMYAELAALFYIILGKKLTIGEDGIKIINSDVPHNLPLPEIKKF